MTVADLNELKLWVFLGCSDSNVGWDKCIKTNTVKLQQWGKEKTTFTSFISERFLTGSGALIRAPGVKETCAL